MGTVTKDMQKALPSSLDMSGVVNAGSVAGQGAGGISLALNIGTFNNQREGDLRTLADEIGTLISANLQRRQVVMA
jgi:hypothetical protein